MKRTVISSWLVLGCLALAACVEGDPSRVFSESPEQRLFDFAAEHLPDAKLRAAASTHFKVTQVTRHGEDRHNKPWVTVGVRMQGPVPFARAIFYVHPDPTAARQMYKQQSRYTRQEIPWPPTARKKLDSDLLEPFGVTSDVPNICGPRFDGLYWCHAYKGRVYLLIQVSSNQRGNGSRDVTGSTKDEAVSLLDSFTTFLEGVVPRAWEPR